MVCFYCVTFIDKVAPCWRMKASVVSVAELTKIKKNIRVVLATSSPGFKLPEQKYLGKECTAIFFFLRSDYNFWSLEIFWAYWTWRKFTRKWADGIALSSKRTSVISKLHLKNSGEYTCHLFNDKTIFLYLIPRSSVLEKLSDSSVNKLLALYVTRRFISVSQEPATCLYPEPDQSSICSHPISWKIHFNVILSTPRSSIWFLFFQVFPP